MVLSFNLQGSLVLLASFLLLPGTRSDLNLDIQALLAFSAYVPHGRKLNWNYNTPICTYWVGITCNENGTHVVSIRLPAVGLYGPIPQNSIGKLDSLSVLSLRSNHLSGNLPSDLISLPSLRHVYLQHNNFSGTAPNFHSAKLHVLDLSFNNFTGAPPNLNISQLRHLNLSYNNLTGPIPLSLQRFPGSSFTGNSLLCGPPLKQCFGPSPSPSPYPGNQSSRPTRHKKPESSHRKLSVGSIIAIAVGSSVAIFFLVCMILFFCLRKKEGEGTNAVSKSKSGGRSEKSKEEFGSGVQEAEKNKLVFFGGSSYNFDLEDLLRASAEVLGKGSYGTAYKAILEEGTTVVVKRLKEVVVGKREFEQQMDMVGRVGEHTHVVPLRAYYYSKDEKLLVYDYIPNGSLSALLHGNEEGRQLDWESRVKITLGAARGLAHIHSPGIEKSVHGNIKSSNVLLSEDTNPRISDYGLTPLMNFPVLPSRCPGYRAPEVIETRRPTQNSDVYSFGVMLLEMLTGKAPVQSPRRDDVVDLPRWVQSVVREEWTAEVFDVELMKYPNIEEELVQMLQIALQCVAKVPDMRPKMEDVVRMIEELRPDSENMPSSEDNKPTSSILHTP